MGGSEESENLYTSELYTSVIFIHFCQLWRRLACDLVTIEHSLLFEGGILYCENDFARLLDLEWVTNGFLSCSHLLTFSNNKGVWFLICWDKFLFVIDLPTQHCQVPEESCSSLFKQINKEKQTWDEVKPPRKEYGSYQKNINLKFLSFLKKQ